jgi:glycosyltransferase involved in cell wall biosynthesis
VYEAGKKLEEKTQGQENGLLKELNGDPYFLHVGAFNKHKNLVRLIEAFQLVKKSNPTQSIYLILAGQAGGSVFSDDSTPIKEAIEKYGLKSNVILTGYISNEDLIDLYKNALAYVFPSFNEGFGLPALEAMAFQLPVIAAYNTCLPEICKEGAIYFDPLNTTEMASQMSLLLNNESERKRIIEKQQSVISLYDWKNSANEIMQVFTEITDS